MCWVNNRATASGTVDTAPLAVRLFIFHTITFKIPLFCHDRGKIGELVHLILQPVPSKQMKRFSLLIF